MATAAVVYVIPTEGKFRYEFQKGRPWQHESLMAPYDFPIYKSEKELAGEKDSILNHCKLYYKYDNEIIGKQFDTLIKSFHIRWEEQLQQYDTIFTDNKKKTADKKIFLSPLTFDKYLRTAQKAFQTIYRLGIIEVPDAFFETYDKIDESDIAIKILRDENISEEAYFIEIFTEKTAYEYLIDKYREINPENQNKSNRVDIDFVEGLNLNDFLAPNLIYDEIISEKYKNTLLDEISLTRDMVQKGQLIILQGDVVNNEKFRVLESLKHEYETYLSDASNFYIILGGQLIVIVMSMIVLFMFLYNFRPEIIKSAAKTSFSLLIFTIIVILTVIAFKNDNVSIYLIPFAIQPILLKTFFDSRIAIFQHTITILLTGFIAPNSFEFVFIQIIVGVIVVMSITNLHSRAQLFASSVYAFLSYSALYFGLALMQEADISNIDWMTFVWFASNSFLLLLVYPAIYIFEGIFGFVSDITLIELSNTNRPLLRRLAEQAPGTFQHSMQVATLAEAAVRRIGGNTLLVRAGAMYHDIGKMLSSNFFIENQSGAPNPHDQLEYDKSADLIISHVTRGVELARKYKLPEILIDFIRTHHGRSKVKYFYISHQNKYPDMKIDEEKFTYPGPSPFSKETAIMMMADAIEAASRTLKSVDETTISNLINNIIDSQIKDNQFNYADITFNDISLIKNEMKNKLINIYHSRIEYPEQKNNS